LQIRDIRSKIMWKAYRSVIGREERFIERLCSSGLAEEVYLVGSRARGDNIPSSDYDIVVITGGDDVLEVAEEIALLKEEPVPIDVIILRREDLEDPVYREMLSSKMRLC